MAVKAVGAQHNNDCDVVNWLPFVFDSVVFTDSDRAPVASREDELSITDGRGESDKAMAW
jgi:hypothetical protein